MTNLIDPVADAIEQAEALWEEARDRNDKLWSTSQSSEPTETKYQAMARAAIEVMQAEGSQ